MNLKAKVMRYSSIIHNKKKNAHKENYLFYFQLNWFAKKKKKKRRRNRNKQKFNQ